MILLKNLAFIKMLMSPAGPTILGNVVNFSTMESIVLMISNQNHAVVRIWNGLDLRTLTNVKPWSRSMTWQRNGNVLLRESPLMIKMKKKVMLDFFSNLRFYWLVFYPIWYMSLSRLDRWMENLCGPSSFSFSNSFKRNSTTDYYNFQHKKSSIAQPSQPLHQRK